MKKSINYLSISVILVGYFVVSLVFKLIGKMIKAKQPPAVIEPETAEKIGFHPTDPQDVFFIKPLKDEDEPENT